MRFGRASPNTSITLSQWCLHRHRATTMSSSSSKLQVTNSCLFFFQATVSREKKELMLPQCSHAVHLARDIATDGLFVCLVQSVPPLSPMLKFVVASSNTSRKCLPLLWIYLDVFHSCLCKHLTSSQRRPVIPKPSARSLCSPLCCPARSYTGLAASGLLRDMSSAPGPGCHW